MFANQYLAYETLSDGMKRMLEGMKAVHDDRFLSNRNAAERNAARSSKLRLGNDADVPERDHPVVIPHPDSGRKAIFANITRTRHFAFLTEEATQKLTHHPSA